MTIEDVREKLHGQPFMPFTLHLADGRHITVEHPEYVALGPRGRTLSVYEPSETHHLIDLRLVTDLETGPEEQG